MAMTGESASARQPAALRSSVRPSGPLALRPVAPARRGLAFTVHASFASAEADWRRFEQEALGTGFQSFDWLAQWHAHAGADVEPAILTISLGGRPLMLAPLGIERHMGARCLVWLGGKFADYKGPLVAPDFADHLPHGRFAALWPKIRRALPKHDVVLFENQPEYLGEARNPFVALGGEPASDPGFVFALPSSYEEFITRFRPETRRNDRVKERKLGGQGALGFRVAATPDEARAMALEILDQKAEQLRQQGIASIFEDEAHRAAYLALAALPAERGLLNLQVAQLTLDGRMISGSIAHIWHGRATLMVHVYDHAHAKLSPGRIHLLKLIATSIEAGHTHYDLSVGHAAYKESFCDAPMALFNLVEAATPWGLASAGALHTRLGLKRAIKTNERLMGWYRAGRALLAGKSA
ncbi:MAG: GNAT family N-acetyltransferase [Parvibaculum sp.]|uniref:GNAT family N-acetyltransferase n=1 Tax=Parvibaculum sp. TaxID=2024848 RepID=UPI003C770F7B